MPDTRQPTSLADVGDLKFGCAVADVAYLCGVLGWAHDHAAGVFDVDTYRSRGLLLGGVGAPLVDEFDVYELAAVLNISSDADTTLVGRVLELHHRLPRLWERVQALQVPVWKAFKITDASTTSDNLAPLCRRHHRTKTHSRWRYHSPEPGLYWTSPHGFTFTIDRRPPPRPPARPWTPRQPRRPGRPGGATGARGGQRRPRRAASR